MTAAAIQVEDSFEINRNTLEMKGSIKRNTLQGFIFTDLMILSLFLIYLLSSNVLVIPESPPKVPPFRGDIGGIQLKDNDYSSKIPPPVFDGKSGGTIFRKGNPIPIPMTLINDSLGNFATLDDGWFARAINLLARFYDPSDGKIKINGQDIGTVRISELRSHMSIVLQDSFLFPISVMDNIRLGRPEASDEEVLEAAKAVGAHEFIVNLPGGYGYLIQEGSSNISIGQRQLISFARTIMTNPDILILDEATSSIDPYTELVIQNALKRLLEDRLVIIIAHRLSTIRLCDEIIVIDHGEVVERGSHSELMKKGGVYSSFYRMQFKEEEGISIT